MRRARTKYLLLLTVALVGCHDAGGAADMAACVPQAGGSGPYACGPLTCAADEYCFFQQYGACAPADLARPLDDGGGGSGGGGGYLPCGEYSCAKLPASCDCNQLCGGPSGQAGPTGCLRSVPACQYSVAGCFLRGSLIFCADQ